MDQRRSASASRIGSAAALLAVALATPAGAQRTERVSVDAGGHEFGAGSQNPSFAADGRSVAFATGGVIYIRSLPVGTTQLVSVSSGGAQGNGASQSPTASSDGRFVAFDSLASNLVATDTNGSLDVFVRDRQGGTTERVSVSSGGVQGNGDSYLASISGDGRYVAFLASASNLVPNDTNGAFDVFVRDRQAGTTTRVSVSSTGVQGDAHSSLPAISADGRYVAFQSVADNLVPGDTNQFIDIFVRDLQNNATERASVGPGGAQVWDASFTPSISADGRFVAFNSYADTLVAGDMNFSNDIFVRDRQAGTTELVSVATGGAQGHGVTAMNCSISPDGRFVAFASSASDLVAGDTNGVEDVFLRDRRGGTTERVSIDSGGVQGNGNSEFPSVPIGGRYVAFQSTASNLVAGDTNSASDIFVRDRDTTGFTSLCSPGTDGVIACPCSNPAGGTGRGCNNSSATGGAILSASGVAHLSSDSLVFTTSGERPTATSVLLQGTAPLLAGVPYGQGVRCVTGQFKRLFTKTASGGSITAPNFGAGDPTVSARSAAKGDPISAGQSRWYLVFYRDPTVLGGCPASSTFNATQTGRVAWSL